MKKIAYALVLALTVTLSACDGAGPGKSEPEKVAKTPTCGMSAEEAYSEGIAKAPDNEKHWAWGDGFEYANAKAYDPCAPLSVISTMIEGPTASSPAIQMLYSYGQYLYPATEKVMGFNPDIERLAPNEIKITYTYSKPGETVAGSSGRMTSVFRFDEEKNEIVRTGELPASDMTFVDTEASLAAKSADKPVLKDEGRRPGVPAEAYEGAGGPIPEGAKKIPVTGVFSQSGESLRTVQTPDKNIGCEFPASGQGMEYCGVMSYLNEGKYPYPVEGDCGNGSCPPMPSWVFSLSDESIAAHPGTSAPGFFDDSINHQIVKTGDVVYAGDYVCAGGESSSLTCWNSQTGHGVYLSREGYKSW